MRVVAKDAAARRRFIVEIEPSTNPAHPELGRGRVLDLHVGVFYWPSASLGSIAARGAWVPTTMPRERLQELLRHVVDQETDRRSVGELYAAGVLPKNSVPEFERFFIKPGPDPATTAARLLGEDPHDPKWVALRGLTPAELVERLWQLRQSPR